LKALELERIPGVTVLSTLLKKEFALSYRHYDTANIKYNHVMFDDKRLWICRLLTFFLSKDAVVVSIDESSFSTKLTTNSRWQPK
jgi:hypothetical protein